MATRKPAKPAHVKITAKLARALCMQELGTAKGLQKSEGFNDRYELRMGNLVIEIRPSYSEPGLVELNYCMHCQCGTTYFYRPDTLEVDFDASAREHTRLKMDYVESWVDSHSNPESFLCEDSHKNNSTVLWDIIRRYFPEEAEGVHIIFGNTGVEYPESLSFARQLGREWGGERFHEVKPLPTKLESEKFVWQKGIRIPL